MAKKRTKAPRTIADLKGDPANPRDIEDDSAAGLQASLAEFGDISGIVFNRQTGELVTGHQRCEQIRERWGDLAIDVVRGDPDRAVMTSPDGHVFDVRLVDWSQARQRAANVAANSSRLAGVFNVDLDDYLADIQVELAAESPTLLEDLLLDELMAVDSNGKQGTASVEETPQETCPECGRPL